VTTTWSGGPGGTSRTDQRRRHIELRRDLYATFRSWGDALFELSDALVCASGPSTSLPGLSLEPEFSRSHGSLYMALEQGNARHPSQSTEVSDAGTREAQGNPKTPKDPRSADQKASLSWSSRFKCKLR